MNILETINTTKIVCEDLKKAGYNVATNKKNTLGVPKFHSRGVGNSVPDLFFWDPLYESEIFNPTFVPERIKHIRAGFIELKSALHRRDINLGIFQNTRYYSYFISNKAIITLNKKQIQNVDVFLVGTDWSRTGMLPKADEKFPPQPIPYLSEKYNIIFPPITINMHSFQRILQELEFKRLINTKQHILANKLNIETGIMISKIPYNDNSEISYEYWAWLGNLMFPLLVKNKDKKDYIIIYVKILDKTKKAIYIETRYEERDWIPKSQIKFIKDQDNVQIGRWTEIKITSWIYKKKEDLFGII